MSASDHFILLSAITLAYTVFGMTGFGAAMVAVPILVHILPLEFAVPLILLMDIVATVSVALKSRRHVVLAELRRLLPSLLVGVLLGATILSRIKSGWLLIALGVFVLAMSARSFFMRRAAAQPVGWQWSGPAGMGECGGVWRAVFSVPCSAPAGLSIRCIWRADCLTWRLSGPPLRRSFFLAPSPDGGPLRPRGCCRSRCSRPRCAACRFACWGCSPAPCSGAGCRPRWPGTCCWRCCPQGAWARFIAACLCKQRQPVRAGGHVRRVALHACACARAARRLRGLHIRITVRPCSWPCNMRPRYSGNCASVMQCPMRSSRVGR